MCVVCGPFTLFTVAEGHSGGPVTHSPTHSPDWPAGRWALGCQGTGWSAGSGEQAVGSLRGIGPWPGGSPLGRALE